MNWKDTFKEWIIVLFEFTGTYARSFFFTIIYSLAFVAFLIAPLIFVRNASLDVTAIWLIIVVPLTVYGVAVAQHVSVDTRDDSLRTKILHALFPGFNKMLFSILVVSIVFYIMFIYDISLE